ncbi:MAG: VTT domain-containing protein [Gemmatimonadota bacterium]
MSFIIDGADYFAAFRAAARRARHSIAIVGWDVDSRIRLVPDGAGDGLPESLGEFLRALLRRARGLQVYVLDWDFAMLVAEGREPRPVYAAGWRTQRRLHFHLDSTHPLGASHHQKIVVIDDALAFVGGFDLTHCRWDTSEHTVGDPRRRHPEGKPCMPFHDLMMAVDGSAAAALGGVVRERWRRATGRSIGVRHAAADPDLWPEALPVDLHDARVAIARTEPAYRQWPEVQEIKQLYLDGIAAARHHLYLENQYFSAAAVAGALERRLMEPQGPDVVLVSRCRDTGWLEESTMGVLRARLHRRLREADRHGHYSGFYPVVPGLGDEYVNVHSKLLIADDELVTIGSANFNNRSMGFDTECNLAIEAAGDERVRAAIRKLRHRLLAEHLGTDAAAVARAERRNGGLLAVIAGLRGGDRSLVVLEPEVSAALDAIIPPGEYVDPERPVALERLVAELVPAEASAPLTRRLVTVGLLLVAFVALAAAWRWTPLGDWLDLARLVEEVSGLRQQPLAPAIVLLGYVVAGFLVVPVTVLIAATVFVFGPWLGSFYALAGASLSALATYGAGRALGRDIVRSLAGPRLNRLSRMLGERGILAMATVRLLPLAPYSIVNLVAGATQIRTRDFLAGTMIGLSPGIAGIALFTDRIVAAIRSPGKLTLGALAVVAMSVVLVGLILRRWLARRGAVETDR